MERDRGSKRAEGDSSGRLRKRLDFERSTDRRTDAGRALGLERMKALMRALDDPQLACRVVHVAGSKGKGSVCEMVAAAAQGCGCVAGLYTSPHLVDLRERIRVGGRMISESDFVAALTEVERAEACLPESLRPVTHFEAVTAAAFMYFRSRAVDVAVIETGMGGLLDATNVVRPDISLIASIQMEHADVLGQTLAEIARHKAGIIKPHTPAATVPQAAEVLAVLRHAAESADAPLAVVGEESLIRVERSSAAGTSRLMIRAARGWFGPFTCPLPGEHQMMNTALALAGLERLRETGLPITADGVSRGLAKTPRRGRMELIARSPRVVVDGAHTPDSIRALLAALPKEFPHDSLLVVFGCSHDKDAGGMLDALCRAADKVILAAASGGRAMPVEVLRALCHDGVGAEVQSSRDVVSAVRAARSAASADDVVLVTGSFAVAGEAKSAVA